MSFSKKTSLFNIANILSFIRIFLAIPLAYSVDKICFESSINDIYLFLGICFLIALTDMLDGYTARAFNIVTNLGKILDPIADKVCVFVLFIFLTINFPNYFLFYFVLLFLRDLIIIISTIYFAKKSNKYFSANNHGKWFLFFISLAMILFIITIPNILSYNLLIIFRNSFYFLSLGFFTLSSIQYFQNIASNLRD